MKISVFSSIVAALMMVALSGCTTEPQACFTVNQTVVNVNDMVTFTSCAQDADRILWNFGDGKTAEGNVVSNGYAAPGTYLVEMKVLSKKDKKWDRSTMLINVNSKKRYLSRITINSFNISNQSGGPWDPAPDQGPDIYLELGLENAVNKQIIAPPAANLQLAQLPVFWDFTTSGLIPLSNQNWTLTLLDNDGIVQLAPEVMATFVFNPFNTQLVAPNVMQLQTSNFQVDLQFVEQ